MRMRRVAIYGRVSTEHEAQLSAFENQQAWYEGVAQQHPDWVVVERYFDEGITGTTAQKRPAFMQMSEDAGRKKFDLVITREVCRFARNTVDTLTVTRELKQLGVEVYFIQDNIWTMDGDGELRLSIMATLAQEESRKISERVLAGQAISREKGVLYGNGNILGYDRVGKTYTINPEQAYTVKKIFELYSTGLGYGRICAELTRLGCKNTRGEVKWTADRIGRVLRNATYKGYICYNKSHSDGYLTQKRINHRQDDYTYIKGDFEPIVSEEIWNQCEELRQKRSAFLKDEDGIIRKFGKGEPKSVWSTKLRCSCGSSFRRFLWHINADGRKTYGYECYRQGRQVSRRYLKSHGLDTSLVCTTKGIPYWQIDLMAHKVFETVWQNQKEAVLMACQMIEECACGEEQDASPLKEHFEAKAQRMKKQQEGLREMRAMGDISREEFLADNQKIQQELDSLQRKIDDLVAKEGTVNNSNIDMDDIRRTLEQWVDLSGPVIPDPLIEQFILQVVVVDDNTFNWTLNLTSDCRDQNLTASKIAHQLYWEKQRGEPINRIPIDTQLSKHITNPTSLLQFTVTEEDAKIYCKSIGLKFFQKKWQDKTVIISI